MTHSLSALDQYFTPDTMSVHFKANSVITSKKGSPGSVIRTKSDSPISLVDLQHLADTLISEAQFGSGAGVEITRPHSKVLQIGLYRVVIVMPPVSDALEITAVRPVKRLTLSDYQLSPALLDLLHHQAKGILISGSPGQGKTTFAQALVDMYVADQAIVKTIESPRDLQVDASVVQYSFHHAPHAEIRDILLLSRPDMAIYDEVRNTEDFHLFKDLRLTGIGLIGVIHATKPVDGIQRFIGTIEMGLIPQIIDTVLFIEKGVVAEILQIKQVVKVPAGMMSADLARPVIVVSSFLTHEPQYEMYSYGEQVVVVDLHDIVTKSDSPSLLTTFAHRGLTQRLQSEFSFPLVTEILNPNSINLYVPDEHKGKIIGKSGENIMALEAKLGISISVKDIHDAPSDLSLKIPPTTHHSSPSSHSYHKKKR